MAVVPAWPVRDQQIVEAQEKALYYVMQSIEGRLGGGEGIEGLYGSLKRMSMQKVLESLISECSLSAKSHLVDVGAGLGRPLLHALLRPGVATASGIEVDRIKCVKAKAFLNQTLAEMLRRQQLHPDFVLPIVQCAPIEQVDSLDPATHAYSFWEGVPVEGKAGFGKLFAASRTLQAVAVVQRAMRAADPAAVMAELGFGPLTLVARFPVSMSGSGRNFTAYVFKRRLAAVPLQMQRVFGHPPAIGLKPAASPTKGSPVRASAARKEAVRAAATAAVAPQTNCSTAAAPATPSQKRAGQQADGAAAHAGQPVKATAHHVTRSITRMLGQAKESRVAAVGLAAHAGPQQLYSRQADVPALVDMCKQPTSAAACNRAPGAKHIPVGPPQSDTDSEQNISIGANSPRESLEGLDLAPLSPGIAPALPCASPQHNASPRSEPAHGRPALSNVKQPEALGMASIQRIAARSRKASASQRKESDAERSIRPAGRTGRSTIKQSSPIKKGGKACASPRQLATPQQAAARKSSAARR